MNVFSIHSHKGGVGKTTFSLFLSKYLSRVKKEKTCLIDFDFQAPGLRGTYLRDNFVYDLADFLLAPEKEKKKIAAQLPVKHEETENLYFIANFYKPGEDMPAQLEILRRVYIKLVNEIYTGEITDNLQDLLKHLGKQGFKNVIIDDHPGLVLLSEEIIKQVKTTPVFITTAGIVSVTGTFKNILGRAEDLHLNLAEIKIIFNRVPENFAQHELGKTLDAFLASRDITSDENLICSKIKESFLKAENGLLFIPEDESIRKIDTLIDNKTILSKDIPVVLRKVIERVCQ